MKIILLQIMVKRADLRRQKETPKTYFRFLLREFLNLKNIDTFFPEKMEEDRRKKKEERRKKKERRKKERKKKEERKKEEGRRYNKRRRKE